MSNWSMRAAACAILALAAGARADSITFVMDNVFSGSGTPSGAPTVTIDDEGTPGSVKFTFDATPLSSASEFIGKWYFNTSVALLGGVFTGFTNISGITVITDLDRTFNTTDAGFKADGDGYYDWVFDFANPNPGRFADGDSFSFYYSSPGITAQTFNVLGISGPGSNYGPFKSAIHLQGTGDDGEGSLWISDGTGTGGGGGNIPEPGLALLALLGIAGGIVARRRS